MIYNQCKIFCIFFVLGILIVFIFDFFRALRKTIKTNNLVIYIEDILFLVIAGIIFYKSLIVFAFGELRFYIIIAILFGMSVYILTISNICIMIFNLILSFFKNIILTIKNIIKIPIKLFLKLKS